MALNISFSTGAKRQITLQDIRELHSDTLGWAASTTVEVSVDRGSQFEPGSTTMTCTQDQRMELAARRAETSSRMDARGPNA